MSGYGHDQPHDKYLDLSDHIPRDDQPIIVATLPTPLAAVQSHGSHFFAPIHTTVAVSAAAPSVSSSPTPSVISSNSSSRLKDAVLDLGRRLSHQVELGPVRPSVQRDLSQASALSHESIDSNATIVPLSSYQDASSSRTPNFYPNQAFSALHHQRHPPIHIPPTVAPSIHPLHTQASRDGLGHRSATSAHIITPGLFQPSPSKTGGSTPIHEAYQAPYLHHLHHQIPKETHVADIDVDPISGRKIINNYEIIDELGRGTHGKVKLGRSLTDGRYVAIKIVERFDKKRRLGRLRTPAEDKVKREVAILKKARHPHVVALLEVIDDPARRKVYIVLERVDMGEIPWRAPGTREIAIVECRRYERESRGIPETRKTKEEDDAILDLGRLRRAEAARAKFKAARKARELREKEHAPDWSLEMAGDFDEESDYETSSRQSSSSSMGSQSDRIDHALIQAKNKPVNFNDSTLLDTIRPSDHHSRLKQIQPDTDATLADALAGTMYGAAEEPVPEEEAPNPLHYHQTDMQPLESILTIEDAEVDVVGLERGLSHDNLAERAAEALDCDMHSDLCYVPCMTTQAARETFRDTLLGLQYLHYQGIIHRDIKPPNLLQTRDHRTKISDFGVSYLGKPVDEDDDSSDFERPVDEAKELAKNVGTVAFYAPELCFTEEPAEQAPIGKGIDIWALGVTLFCMIFARVPFVDNEFVVMRRIAEEEVFIPKKRLMPVDSKPPFSNDRIRHYSGNATHRGVHSLEYEELDDLLLDLLKRLLTKDVRKRATLDEVRHHPWVMDDLADKMGWLESSAPSNNAEGKKIEISREDLETSVVPITIIDRIRSGFKKAVDSASSALGRTSSTKRRGPSQDSSASSSPSLGGALYGRRASLRGDEPIINALKASREPSEHPLSQSQTASPVGTPGNRHRLGPSPLTPTPERSADRMAPRSTMSTTNSSKTIRPIDATGDAGYFDTSLPTSPLASVDGVGIHNIGNLMGGATRLLKSSRDRSVTSRGDERWSTPSSRSSDAGDAHADPSIALSTAFAAGQSIVPQVLKEPVSVPGSPAMSRSSSVATTPDLSVRQGGFEDFRAITAPTSASTASSRSLALADQKLSSPLFRPSSRLSDARRTSVDHFHDDVLHRHLTGGSGRASPASATHRHSEVDPQSPDTDVTPPSRHGAISTESIPPSAVPSLETGPTSPGSSVMPTITPVSSTDRFDNELVHQASYQEDSTAPYGERLALSPIRENIGVPHKMAVELLEEDDGYRGDMAIDSDDSEYDSSSDDDGGLTMSRRKPVHSKSTRSASVSNAQLLRNRERRHTGGSGASKRSSRSGSSKRRHRA